MDNPETRVTLETKHRTKTYKRKAQLRNLERWATRTQPKLTWCSGKVSNTIPSKTNLVLGKGEQHEPNQNKPGARERWATRTQPKQTWCSGKVSNTNPTKTNLGARGRIDFSKQAIFLSYWEMFVRKKSERGDSGMGQHGQRLNTGTCFSVSSDDKLVLFFPRDSDGWPCYSRLLRQAHI
jgi:hypothetical protein